MSTATTQIPTSTVVPTKRQNRQALQIIARSLFRELKQNGFDGAEIVSLSTELLGLVATDLKGPKQGPAS